MNEQLPERPTTAGEQRRGDSLDERLAQEDPHPPRARRARSLYEDGDEVVADREKDTVAATEQPEGEAESGPPATIDEAAGMPEAPPAEEAALREDDESSAPGLVGGPDGYVDE